MKRIPIKSFRHHISEATKEPNWLLGFEFSGDYSSRGREVTKDLSKKYKKYYSGSGSSGQGYDISFNGPKKELEKIKKHIEKTYKKEIVRKDTMFTVFESVKLGEAKVIESGKVVYQCKNKKEYEQFMSEAEQAMHKGLLGSFGLTGDYKKYTVTMKFKDDKSRKKFERNVNRNPYLDGIKEGIELGEELTPQQLKKMGIENPLAGKHYPYQEPENKKKVDEAVMSALPGGSPTRKFDTAMSKDVKDYIMQTKPSEFIYSADSVLGGNSKFVVIPVKRDMQKPGNDGVLMAIISNPARGSRKIFTYMGTHRNVAGAKKFAKNNKLVESVELDENMTFKFGTSEQASKFAAQVLEKRLASVLDRDKNNTIVELSGIHQAGAGSPTMAHRGIAKLMKKHKGKLASTNEGPRIKKMFKESVELDEALVLASDSRRDVEKTAKKLAKQSPDRTYYVVRNLETHMDRYEVVDSVDMHMYKKSKKVVGYGKDVKESVELGEGLPSYSIPDFKEIRSKGKKLGDWMGKSYYEYDGSVWMLKGGRASNQGPVAKAKKKFNKDLLSKLKFESVELGEGFKPAMLRKLKTEYGKINKIDPSSPAYKKLKEKIQAMSKVMLIQIADADIKFMSGLARNELQRKYGKSMLSKKESVELDEGKVSKTYKLGPLRKSALVGTLQRPEFKRTTRYNIPTKGHIVEIEFDNDKVRKAFEKKMGIKESVELDEAAVEVRELELFITNNGNLYKQRIKPIIKNYRRKIGKGVYDEKLASKGFLHAVADGIREYNKEFGAASMILTRQQKEEVALLLLRNYQDEIREGVDNDEKASAKILDMIN
mgnify:FL=1